MKSTLLRCLSALGLVLALQQSASAQALVSVQKHHQSIQTGPTTAVDDTPANGLYRFSMSMDATTTGAHTVTAPGGGVQTLAFDAANSEYAYAAFFSTQASMDVTWPDGTYTFAFNGLTKQASLTGSAYPNIPLAIVSQGTWSNGVLTVDPTQPLTITMNFTTNFFANHSHSEIHVNSSSSAPNYNLHVQSPDFSTNTLTATIPANTLTGGGANYFVTMDLDNVPTLDQSVSGFAIVSIYEQETSFTIQSGAGAAPIIQLQPANQTVTVGGSVTFGVQASGSGPFTRQWFKNNVAINGATNQTYTITGVQLSDAGTYKVVVSNQFGSATSANATLTVNPVQSPPSFTVQPVPLISATAGGTVVLNTATTGFPAPTYRWTLNGTLLPQALGPRIVLNNFSSANAGTYVCTAQNPGGTAVSTPAVVNLTTTTNPGRLVNLSILSNIVGTQTVGFVIGGAGTSGSQNLLIRAIGPALAGPPFNVPNVMPDPSLTVIRQTGTVTVGTNTGWGTPLSNVALIQAANVATGAFALTNPASFDSALAAAFAPVAGGYSVQINSKTGAQGNAIAEFYDNTPSYTPASTRLVNLSCLTRIASGGSLSTGFVIGGATARTVLVRAIGPSVGSAPFNVPGVMADPQMTVRPLGLSTVLSSGAAWGGDPSLVNAAINVGAFALSGPSSADSVTLLTLPPGGYTAVVSSVTGAGGTILVEVYEVP